MHARHRTLCKKNKKGSIDWAGPCGFQDQLNPYLPKIPGHNRPRFLIPQESGPCRLQTTDTWFVFKITHDAPQGSGDVTPFLPLNISHVDISRDLYWWSTVQLTIKSSLESISPPPPPPPLSPFHLFFEKC